METPVKKKRGRPRTVDQAACGSLTAAPARATAGSNSQITSNADTSSQPYQYATEINTNHEEVTTNGGLDDLFESLEGDPDLDNLFEEARPDEFMKRLLDYTQAPNSTQAVDDEWNKIMDTSLEPAHTFMPEGQLSADCPLATVERSPTFFTTETTNRITTPAAVPFSATPETSIARSHSTSLTTDILGKSCSPHSLKVPKPSLYTGFCPPSAGNGDEAADLKFIESESTGSERDFPEPQEIQKKTPRHKFPARQPLGSPFAPATAPARQATQAMMDMLNSPAPAGNGRIPMSNPPMSSSILRGQNPTFNVSLPNMIDPNYRPSSVLFSSPPNPTLFAANLHTNNLLQSDFNMPQQSPAKRMRMNSLSTQEAIANAHHEQHIRQQIHMQTQLRSGSINPQLVSFDHSEDVQNWIDTTPVGTPASETMAASGKLYEYPIPLPTGSVDGIEQELSNSVNVGQKRTAAQMVQGGMPTGNIQTTPRFVSQGLNTNGDSFAGLHIPQNQLQYAMAMQRRAQMIQNMQMQAAMGLRCGSQSSPPNHFSSPSGMQDPDQAQDRIRQHHQMALIQSLQGQRQREVSQGSPGQQMLNAQQQKGLPTQHVTPSNPIGTPEKTAHSSQTNANTELQETPTPAPRRRVTASNPTSKMLSSSPPVVSPSVSKVRKASNIQNTQNRCSSVNPPQRRTFSAKAQASGVQNMKTPGNMAAQAEAFFRQTLTKTPENHTRVALRVHLPTPQKPISTGACPNTVNETLEETNRRTSAQFRGVAVPMMNTGFDGDPRNNGGNMPSDYTAFETPNDTSYCGSGLPFENMDFTDMMGGDMNLGTGFNADMNGYTAENPSMDTFQNVGPPANMHVDMRPENLPMHTNGTFNTTNTPLGESLLNSNIHDSSFGYAETIVSEALGHTLPPVNDITVNAGGATMNTTKNQSALPSPLKNDTTSSQTAGSGTEALPALADNFADPDDQLLAEWVKSFDENADFNPDDWGV